MNNNSLPKQQEGGPMAAFCNSDSLIGDERSLPASPSALL